MSELKPLVALTKAYRGGEWFEASLESVAGQCTGAVVVLSSSPWRGVAGNQHRPENCREPMMRFQRHHPEFRVVTVPSFQRQDTEEQYKIGLKAIQSKFGPDHGVLLLDTDEIWDDADLLKLREAMTRDTQSLCFRVGIWTYLRSPLWRVHPQEPARVAVGLSKPMLPTGKSRLANIHQLYSKQQIADVDCAFHHFGYVRVDPNEITEKLVNSTSQDKVPVLDNWKGRVWDLLPAGKDIHPQAGFERCWGGVAETDINSLPRSAVRSNAFWAGLIWHSGDRLWDLFTRGDPTWRHEVESMSPQECPATTVSLDMGAALVRLTAGLGKDSVPAGALDWLLPRLRMSFRETVQLALLTSRVPEGGKLLEIGSGLGGSMATMMLSCPVSATLTAVDPYLPYDEQNVVLDRAVTEGSAAMFHDTCTKTAYISGPRRVALSCVASRVGATGSRENVLDLLLVDGNHSYVSCKEDLDLWWPALKSGGLLLVHDYASRFPGVVLAVKEFEAQHGILFDVPLRSTLAWLRKP